MKKIFTFILIIMLFLLIGCGGDGKDPNEGGNPDNPSEGENNQNQEEKKYVVTFVDENNSTIESKEWKENTKPSCSYEVKDTVEWDYTFEGWAETNNGDVLESLPSVTKEVTYYAIVSKVKQVYTLSFDSLDGTDVEAIVAEYGTQISEPQAPTKENHRFMGWSTSKTSVEEVQWPITLSSNTCLYAVWNEKVNIKSYLNALTNGLELNPYSYIPETMLSDYAKNNVSQNEVNYDYTKGVNINNIKFGGFGDQWNMVLSNINQSETFYNVLTSCESLINTSVALFNNYLDSNPEDTASHEIKKSEYTAKIEFKDNILTYIIELKTNINIPLIGNITPQIAMILNVETNLRTVRINLNDENAILYEITENSYAFAIEYGIESLSRKALFIVQREDGKVNGHIFEFISTSNSDVVSSAAQFYIDEEYVSVVGNKAQAIVAFDGYINELYLVSSGKLLGFEVREKLTFASIEKQYDTLWFNLNEFSGISSIKAIKNDDVLALTGAKNAYNIYLNGSEKIFKPKYNTLLLVETSRKYDVELRNQYFYGYEDEKIVEYKTSVPMMFVQAEDLDDLVDYLSSYSKVSTTFNLNTKHIEKIQSDYATLIDIFIASKDSITSDLIDEMIGNLVVFK